MAEPASDGGSRGKSVRTFLIRGVISVTLIGLMVWAADWRMVLDKLRNLSIWAVLFFWAYYAFCQWLSAYRWKVLLRAKGVNLPTLTLFNFYMVGMFANNFLPGGLGGDAVKAWSLYRHAGFGNVAIASVFVERFCGILALSALGCLAALWVLVTGNAPITALWVLATALALAVAAGMVWSIRLAGLLRGLLARFAPRAIRERAITLMDTVHSYRNDLGALGFALAISVVLQAMIALFYNLVGVALGTRVDTIYFLLFLPIITIITLLPISLGGLGPREFAMVYLFGKLGISSADVLAISLTAHVLNVALSLVGGPMLLLDRYRYRRAAAATPGAALSQQQGS
jgi:uncharacterized protein (TIRG00374 family)